MPEYQIDATVVVEEIQFGEEVTTPGVSVHGDLTGRSAPDQHPGTAISLTDNTLGVLDPDQIQTAINEWYGAFGLDEDAMTAAVQLLSAIVTNQPATPQVAFENVSKLLGLLFTSGTIAAQDVAAMTATVAALGATVAAPTAYDLWGSGAEARGKWAIVCSPGRYVTGDIGDLNTLAPAGYEDTFRVLPIAGDPDRVGALVAYLEIITQWRQLPGAWGADQDNDELAVTIYKDELGVLNEHCRSDTPAETEGGEYVPGRLNTSAALQTEGTWVDPFFKLALGQPFSGKFRHELDVVIDGQHYGRKTLLVRVSEPWATEVDAEDRYWRKVAETVYPGPDSVANAGMPWVVGLNGGYLGVEHLDRKALVSGDTLLHFDTADLQPDGTVSSSVIMQTWEQEGTPYVVDTTIPGLEARFAAIEEGGANGASAYEVAVANGFVGDEAAWLLSLEGTDGTDGKTILYGTAAPTTEGVDGDFYIRTTTNFLYGPKASGEWPAGTSIVGPAGTPGNGLETSWVTADAPLVTSTLTNISGLSFAVLNGVKQAFKVLVIVTGTTADLDVAVTGPSGALHVYVQGTSYASSSYPNTAWDNATSTSGARLTGFGVLPTGPTFVVIEGVVIPTADGTVQVQCSQRATNGAAPTTIKAGSYITHHT